MLQQSRCPLASYIHKLQSAIAAFRLYLMLTCWCCFNIWFLWSWQLEFLSKVHTIQDFWIYYFSCKCWWESWRGSVLLQSPYWQIWGWSVIYAVGHLLKYFGLEGWYIFILRYHWKVYAHCDSVLFLLIIMTSINDVHRKYHRNRICA